MDNKVFLALVQLTKMAPAFAEQVVMRAVVRSGCDVMNLQEQDVAQILPHLESAMKMFVTADNVQLRLQAIRVHFKIKDSKHGNRL